MIQNSVTERMVQTQKANLRGRISTGLTAMLTSVVTQEDLNLHKNIFEAEAL